MVSTTNSALETRVKLALSRQLSSKLTSVRGPVGRSDVIWSVDQVQVKGEEGKQHKTANATVALSGLSSFDVQIKIDEDTAENELGSIAAENLPKEDYIANIEGVAYFNLATILHLTLNDDSKQFEIDSFEQSGSDDSMDITPTAFSIGGHQYQELGTHFDMIERNVADSLKKIVDDNILPAIKTVQSIDVDDNLVISSSDLDIYKTISEAAAGASRINDEIAPIVNKYRGAEMLSKRSDSEDGLVYTDFVSELSEAFSPYLQLPQGMIDASARTKSSELKMAIGLPLNSLSNQARDVLRACSSHIMSYNEKFKFSSRDERDEMHIQFCDQLLNYLDQLSSIFEKISKASSFN